MRKTATADTECSRLQTAANSEQPKRRKAKKGILRYRLKAPDGSIHVAIDDEFDEVAERIEAQFGEKTATLLPVQLVEDFENEKGQMTNAK